MRHAVHGLAAVVSCSATLSYGTPDSDPPAYRDASRPILERTANLLGQMTLDEKIGQMTQASREFLKSDEDITLYALGSVLSGGGSGPKRNVPSAWVDMYDGYQRRALKTRLSIPLLYGIDAVHGHNNVRGAVIFPHNIGLGATRNPTLVEEVARATAIEVAATGIRWTFSPCIAVPRDERWGRTYEGFGETAELASVMGRSAIRGYQGDDLAKNTAILACAKHFIGDGGTLNGVDRGDTVVDETVLRQVHLPGYVAAVDVGVGSIMASFNSWNGQKVHGRKDLLSGILKGELGFGGFIVSDWKAIEELAGDYADEVEQAINAGIDMVMVPDNYPRFFNTLKAVVSAGRVSMDRIDDAVGRILTIKFRLGLFEHPFADRSLSGKIGAPEHRALARRAVRESLVLLKNERQTLPLSKRAHILLAGSGADDIGRQCGGWTISWQGETGPVVPGTTILEAVRRAVSREAIVTYSPEGEIPKGAQVAVVVIGETPYAETKGDRRNLDLDPADIKVVERVHKGGIPAVVVLLSGRPLILTPVLPLADAIVAAWLPGTEGDGVADVLFGDFRPTGKLGHSWPASMTDIPLNDDRRGPDSGATPLWPYGFGLSY